MIISVLVNLTEVNKVHSSKEIFVFSLSAVFFLSDYESLRIGGLIFAVVLFLMGIALIASKCVITWC